MLAWYDRRGEEYWLHLARQTVRHFMTFAGYRSQQLLCLQNALVAGTLPTA